MRTKDSSFDYEKFWASFDHNEKGEPIITEINSESAGVPHVSDFDDFCDSLLSELEQVVA